MSSRVDSRGPGPRGSPFARYSGARRWKRRLVSRPAALQCNESIPLTKGRGRPPARDPNGPAFGKNHRCVLCQTCFCVQTPSLTFHCHRNVSRSDFSLSIVPNLHTIFFFLIYEFISFLFLLYVTLIGDCSLIVDVSVLLL